MGCDCVTSCLFSGDESCSISPLIICKRWQFYCLLLPILLTFVTSYVEHCYMLSGNQCWLYINSFFSSCSPHILRLISLIDPCTVYFQGDIFLLSW
jgi:hypothetical protein